MQNKDIFFETAVDFLPPSLSIGTPAWKWRNGLTGNRILISCKMFPQPSDGIKQWGTRRRRRGYKTEKSCYRKPDPRMPPPCPHCALWTLHPALPRLWWKAGRNPFQFGQCAPVLLKAIDWLNRGTISQYAGADEPGRGERRDMAP